MNREILFRGKVKLPDNYRGHNLSYRNGDWVYGLMNSNGSIRGIFVNTNTIGQYTGLTDKNGTKIFDGDVLHFGDKNYLVFWNDECFQWQMRIRKDGFSFPVYSGQDTGCPVECITLSWVAAEIPILGTMSTEIVGNIYDNPELIEE